MSLRKTVTAFLASALSVWLCLFLAGCAGGGSSKPPAVITPATVPAQTALTITTSGSLAPGTFGQFYKATLQASGGTPPYQWFPVIGDPLSAGLTLSIDTGDLSGVLTDQAQFAVAVFDAKLKSAMANITVPLNASPVKIITSVLPPATVAHSYNVSIQCNQRNNGCSFALQSPASSLPPGLTFSQGNLSGMPTAGGSFMFTVSAASGSSTDQRSFTLVVADKQPRNDAISSATALSNGQWSTSISPYHDASANGPDEDYYALTAPGGSFVSINIFAQRINSPMQPVLEIVDQNGQRFRTCSDAGISAVFTNPCMSDEIIAEQTLDAMLTFKVPGTGTQKFFVHVLDWRGDARPDMLYQMAVFGAD
jgi:hypothetical protein